MRGAETTRPLGERGGEILIQCANVLHLMKFLQYIFPHERQLVLFRKFWHIEKVGVTGSIYKLR